MRQSRTSAAERKEQSSDIDCYALDPNKPWWFAVAHGNLDGDPYPTHLYGTKSGAIVSPWDSEPVKIFTEDNKQLFNMVPKNIPHVQSAGNAEVEAFLRAILEKKPNPVPGEDGLILNAIFDALYKSSETGKEEKVDVSV